MRKFSTNCLSVLLACFCLIAVEATTVCPSLVVRGGKKAEVIPVVQQSEEGPLQLFIKTIQESRKHLIAAGVARSISIFAMFPVDTIKTRLQMGQSNPFSMKGVYSGVGGSLVGQVPYGVLTFGSYEMYKKAFMEKLPNVKPAFVYALAAICGDVTGSGWVCPSEVVKQQTQAGMYSSTGAAVKGIFAKKGIKGFYQGYAGGLARDVPFRVAQLVSYEMTKNFYIRLKRVSRPTIVRKLTYPPSSLPLWAVAGSFSASITSPLDRIKTLLMTDSAAYGGTINSCISKILRDEGMAGLCQGMAPRVLYVAPSVVIFFIAYEQVQQRLSD